MPGEKRKFIARPQGFMGALARDVRGNTMAIMAATLIPLAGLVGGGIDISRMYIVKTRLQHACDAAALAARKTMGGGTWASTNANATATLFFNGNFPTNAYGSGTVTKEFTESAGKVSGTASVPLPMTLMKIFGKSTETMSVNCDADMRLPNTDIMFVLDNTGSMSEKAISTDPENKMDGLKVAVKCFYEIVARLDTDATCAAGAPSGGTGSQTQIRFGFVPYSTNVNVGKLLPNAFMADSWNYQSREANWIAPGTTSSGLYWQVHSTSIPQSDCLRYMGNLSFTGFTPTATSSGGPAPAPTVTTSFTSDGAATEGGTGEWGWSGAPDTEYTNRSCRRMRTDVTRTYVPTFDDWDYDSVPITVSGLKAGGSSWNSSITAPIGANGTARTIQWDGCIEERRPTVLATDYDPIPSGAKDLDIDLVPSAGVQATLWGPALSDLIYLRSKTSNWNWDQLTQAAVNGTTADYDQDINYFCPAAAIKLQKWPDATVFDTYVNGLVATGNTYHDIGMLWGARLMSPTGIFASENALTPGGAEIERHMIFMTDGDAVSQACDYTAYGIAFFDQRTTTDVGPASNRCSNTNGGRASLNNQINYRLEALCTAVKNKNITLWVISFGSGSNTVTEGRLESCASSGRYFVARGSADLQAKFVEIANQISALRLTR